MDKEENKDPGKQNSYWYIDLGWYQGNNRSFSTLAKNRLCPKCAAQLSNAKEVSDNKLISTIRDCCSHTPDFINDRLSVMESIFRILLSNGNQPVSLEELGRQLSEKRSLDIYCASAEFLSRIMNSETCYGLQEFKGEHA
jgi:hypothetical protein